MTVYEAIANVICDLPAIGKDSLNQAQGFKFRGIEDIVKEIKPLLGKHGLFIVPERSTIERGEVRTAKNGSHWYPATVTIGWLIYARDGSQLWAETSGEGLDNGDKAVSKANTMAYKTLLLQLFAIADVDGDAFSPGGMHD
jgi:hypothetical protein